MKTTAELQARLENLREVAESFPSKAETIELIEEILRLREEVADFERHLENLYDSK